MRQKPFTCYPSPVYETDRSDCTMTNKHASEITLCKIGFSINTTLFHSILEVLISQSIQALGLMDYVNKEQVWKRRRSPSVANMILSGPQISIRLPIRDYLVDNS